jgi:aminoglycoside phosphotransferase family enzyme/predicted kinase
VPSADVEARVPLAELIEGLSRPGALGVEGPIEVVQTHVSVVFLVGDRAFKVKKPLRLWGFLDYGTLEARRRCCEDEVRLNRRLAADLYLGVVPIVRRRGGLHAGGRGDLVEHAVEMVRFAPEATMEARLTTGSILPAEVERVAETLAAFHGANRLEPEDARLGLPSAFGWILGRNLEATRAGVPDPFPDAVHEGLARRLAARLAAARGTIRARVRAGRMVDGHGDVRLEHVLRHQGRILIVDCVEFTERLRHVDALSDLAFLSMDMRVRGRADLAQDLEAAYLARAPDLDAPALMPLWLAYRAHVRANVDLMTSREAEVPEETRRAKDLSARRHLALAWTLARTGATPPLVLLRGPSGSGKSVLARAIAPWLGAEVVSSDVVRKGLLGLAPTDRPRGAAKDAAYSKDVSAKTYRAMLAKGLDAIRRGQAAILDATFLLRPARLEALRAARSLGAPFAVIDVDCPPKTVRERLLERAARDTDASDADWLVYEAQLREAEALVGEEADHRVPYAAGEAPEALAMRLLDALERRGPASEEGRAGPWRPRARR